VEPVFLAFISAISRSRTLRPRRKNGFHSDSMWGTLQRGTCLRELEWCSGTDLIALLVFRFRVKTQSSAFIQYICFPLSDYDRREALWWVMV
jgi:hypothetical protein